MNHSDRLDQEIEEAREEARRVHDEMAAITTHFDQLEARISELSARQDRVLARLEYLLSQGDG